MPASSLLAGLPKARSSYIAARHKALKTAKKSAPTMGDLSRPPWAGICVKGPEFLFAEGMREAFRHPGGAARHFFRSRAGPRGKSGRREERWLWAYAAPPENALGNALTLMPPKNPPGRFSLPKKNRGLGDPRGGI